MRKIENQWSETQSQRGERNMRQQQKQENTLVMASSVEMQPNNFVTHLFTSSDLHLMQRIFLNTSTIKYIRYVLL